MSAAEANRQDGPAADDLVARATAWRDHDPDPTTRAHLTWLLDAATDGNAPALAELSRAMDGPLQFGTAGLRGEVGAGESRMNLAVVLRTTAGLVAWLQQKTERAPRVVIGCDARHGSVEWSRAAAEVVAAAGGEALLLPALNPTPLTAFSVRHYDADAGIMVTASHNPPRDNGYKVYLGGTVATGDAAGVQIVSPADAEIAASVAAQPSADEIPRSADGVTDVNPTEDYVAAASSLAAVGTPEERASLKIALTTMHGVGAQLALRSLRAAGFTGVELVPAQAIPDPEFPTVAFPNPEEKGALDLAKAFAAERGSDLIIALDPDADRCALAIPTPGGYRQLTGDETGSILGEFVAAHADGGVLANSIVSSRLLEQIAKGHGLDYAHTLTGFKWIGRTPGLIFGYEEAIGYCPDPAHTRDKDGVATAVLAASLFAGLKAEGRTPEEELDRIAARYGLYLTGPVTFRVDDLSKIEAGMTRLRTNPPAELAGARVTEIVDLADGALDLPPQNALIFTTERDDRVVARPSGTEPKLKCYLEVHMPVADRVPRREAEARLAALSAAVREIVGL